MGAGGRWGRGADDDEDGRFRLETGRLPSAGRAPCLLEPTGSISARGASLATPTRTMSAPSRSPPLPRLRPRRPRRRRPPRSRHRSRPRRRRPDRRPRRRPSPRRSRLRGPRLDRRPDRRPDRHPSRRSVLRVRPPPRRPRRRRSSHHPVPAPVWASALRRLDRPEARHRAMTRWPSSLGRATAPDRWAAPGRPGAPLHQLAVPVAPGRARVATCRWQP